MPVKFFNPSLMANGDLRVTGPFETTDALVGDVQVRFLLIQKPPARSTTPPWMIDGVATCPNGSQVFEAIVSRAALPADFSATDDVRGIGLAVAVKRFPPAAGNTGPPPTPVFETLTWCVDLTIDVETPSSG